MAGGRVVDDRQFRHGVIVCLPAPGFAALSIAA
jgi:hypothetical protein